MRFFFALVFLFLIGAAFSSYACDKNRPEELAERQKEGFKRFDVNNDDLISVEEFVSKIQKWEIDHYLMLHKEENLPVDAVAHHLFKNTDRDNSGSLTFGEWGVLYPPNHFMLRCGG